MWETKTRAALLKRGKENCHRPLRLPRANGKNQSEAGNFDSELRPPPPPNFSSSPFATTSSNKTAQSDGIKTVADAAPPSPRSSPRTQAPGHSSYSLRQAFIRRRATTDNDKTDAPRIHTTARTRLVDSSDAKRHETNRQH
ncbi:hypothetical protein CC2G_003848 [Coprinopsis cinerea AmutBmut pab1-1]|nr:hypothetical protein CC2G_003848 [Coprinopsis cinerea AmutBmut pab1-1]